MGNSIKLAPSILSADFSRLGEQVAEVASAGADYIHIDVMDGCFVPNITIGTPVVRAIRPCTDLPFDVHLMIESPERHVARFAEAGADIITVHAEACPRLREVVEMVKGLGVRAGASVNPDTPLEALGDVLPFLDLVLVMTVDPGFPGQPFIEGVVPKIAEMRRTLDVMGLGTELEVDGGITTETAPRAVGAGARVLVAGSAIFNRREGVAEAVARLRESLRQLEGGG